MIYNNLIYSGVGCIALGIIALYLLLLCKIYAYTYVCIDDREYSAAVLCASVFIILIGAGFLVVGLGTL